MTDVSAEFLTMTILQLIQLVMLLIQMYYLRQLRDD